LPPHPAPTSVAFLYHADVNKTLFYGIIVAIPAIIIAGPVLSLFYKNLNVVPPKELYIPRDYSKVKLPSLWKSLATALCPIFLMLSGAILQMIIPSDNKIINIIRFFSDPSIALFITVFIGVLLLGIGQRKKMSIVMKNLSDSVATITMILLIIAAGGAFKQVVTDSGSGEYIKIITKGLHFSPLILAWCLAALLRFAVGSATVACITAAGLALPFIKGTSVSPELMVLATGAGSLMFSHFNDIGFWMFKEYFNTTVKQTFAVWTVMETLIGIIGLLGVLILSHII
jgi:Gnt-I system high-affinity gluconate transporter